MNRPVIVATSLVVLTLFVSLSHATSEEYSAYSRTLEELFGDGKRITKLYAGRKQPDSGLAQILVLYGLSITAVDGDSVKSKRDFLGYKAYEQLPGTYEFEVTSWKRRSRKHLLGSHSYHRGQRDKQAAYVLQAVLELGQKYVLSPIWNDGELGAIAPSKVCVQGQSDDARYCALRPRESDDVFAMDEKHGVIIVGLIRNIRWEKIRMINLDCEWKGTEPFINLDKRKAATKLRDVCEFAFEAVDSKGYTVESIDAGVWKWWGFSADYIRSGSPLITTTTFDIEPGKVNYVGHVGAIYKNGKRLGLRLVDRFSQFEPIIRAGFGDAEIVNKATHYSGFEDSEIEAETTN